MHQDGVCHPPRSHGRVVSRKSRSLTSAAPHFRHRVAEQPHKIPYYAALLKILHEPPPPEIASGFPEGVSLGRSLLEDIWKGFQGYLDQLAWREIRLCVSPLQSILTSSPTQPRPIDPILCASDNSKYHLRPDYDFAASVVHNCFGRIRCLSREG
jgi:nuclear cap-binding protein subunit 1